MKLTWKVEAPAPSPLEPTGPAYRVHWAEHAKMSNAAARAALDALGEEALRVAPGNLDRKRPVVLFQWNYDFAAVSAVFTSSARDDATDVLKLFFTGWERQQNKDHATWLSGMPGFIRSDALCAWCDAIAVKMRPRFAKVLPGPKLRFAFKHKTWAKMRPIGSGRYRDPYGGR